MKKLLTLKTGFILAGMMFVFQNNASANGGEKYPLELDLLKKYLMEVPTKTVEEKIYKFYDVNDNLVYQAKVDPMVHSADKKLVKFLNESDYLAEVKDVKIHRLKN